MILIAAAAVFVLIQWVVKGLLSAQNASRLIGRIKEYKRAIEAAHRRIG